jgi:hypothetical protein
MTFFVDHPAPILANARGGTALRMVAIILALSLLGGGGYWAYVTFHQKEPLRTRLTTVKMRQEVIRFTRDSVSSALYQNMVTLDDIVAMMDRELKRLQRIGRRFPNQGGIVKAQIDQLETARRDLFAALSDVTAAIETLYVTWLVDCPTGTGQINARRGTLTRQLADAIRNEAALIGRIRSNPEAAAATL